MFFWLKHFPSYHTRKNYNFHHQRLCGGLSKIPTANNFRQLWLMMFKKSIYKRNRHWCWARANTKISETFNHILQNKYSPQFAYILFHNQIWSAFDMNLKRSFLMQINNEITWKLVNSAIIILCWHTNYMLQVPDTPFIASGCISLLGFIPYHSTNTKRSRPTRPHNILTMSDRQECLLQP